MATTIAELQVEIKALTSKFEKDIDGATKSASASLEKFAGVAKIASLAAATAIGAGVVMAVKSFAEYEQLTGGVETLFKDSAKTVEGYANDAYKTAGLSANRYMDTVTSFSASLLQGLGGDTKKAADYADMAVRDMADNANKFGTDIGSIQFAYQGFAKDNFTMLDNLKLGFGGTAGEMARLVNESGVMGDSFEATAENVKDIPFDKLVLAIHKTQEEMDIAGTTAKEASDTISGSWASVKASFENVLTGIKGSGADLGETALNLASQLAKKVPQIAARLATGLTEAIETILSHVDWAAVYAKLIPDENIRDGLTNAFNSLAGAVQAAWNVMQPLAAWFISTLWPVLVQVGEYIGGQLKSAWDSVSESLVTIAPFLKLVGMVIGGIVVVALVLLVGAIAATLAIGATLINWTMKATEFFYKLAASVVEAIGWIIGKAVELYNNVVKWFGEAWNFITSVWSAAPGFFGGIILGIVNPFIQIPVRLGGLFIGAWNAVVGIWDGAPGWFGGLVNGIFGFFGSIPGRFSDIFHQGWNAVTHIDWAGLGRAIVDGIVSGLNPGRIVGKMKDIASSALAAAKETLGIHSPSKVMRDEVGKMMGLGVAVGIDDSAKYALSAASRMSNSLVGALDTPMTARVDADLRASMSGSGRQTPVVVNVDGKTLLSFVIDGINDKSFMSNTTSISV